MAILLPGKFVYLANPHTASLATADALCTIDGTFRIAPHHISWRDFGQGEVRSAQMEKLQICVQQLLTGAECIIATARNPYDWLVTCWLRRKDSMNGICFKEYVTIVDQKSPGAYIKDDRLLFHEFSHLLKYENLENDLNSFLKSIGQNEVKLSKRNVTPNKMPWRDYFDREIFDIINGRFRRDFDRLSYPIE